ncbi:5-oxoprolinase [Syncephalis fuscata]|nr:5-oxoprolinase [Syncephalis fuscata]
MSDLRNQPGCNIRFSIDRGGTFTDCVAHYPVAVNNTYPKGVATAVEKLLSVDPSNYPDAPREGIRRLLERITGRAHPKDELLSINDIESIRMGTTVATNALLERKGEPCALFITKGFKDLLVIGNQSRPDIFDLSITVPDQLYTHVIEVDERVTLLGAAATHLPDPHKEDIEQPNVVKGLSGEYVRIIRRPDLKAAEQELRTIYAKGIKSLAICFLHAYTFPDHEQEMAKLATSIGFDRIFTSEAVQHFVPRAHSTVANAYLTPVLQDYVNGFLNGFTGDSREFANRVLFMRSDGGLCEITEAKGAGAVVSGPAGGVVGYAMTSWDKKEGVPIIGFDMGGTSTDVSRYDGNYEHVFEAQVAGVTLQAPQLDIHTVAAGGGSRLFFRNGLFDVGPESAGAHPGPACYRKGGPLTISDANLITGRLLPAYFPKIFGPNEDLPLDVDAAYSKFEELTKEINIKLKEDGRSALTVDQVALGFLQVANEAMCRPIRALTEAKGHPASHHALACFGGAGGQHACAIARSLGIETVLLHRHASVLSAYGLSLADVVHEEREPFSAPLTDRIIPDLQERTRQLSNRCEQALKARGFTEDSIEIQLFLNLRYQGTDTSMMTTSTNWEFKQQFIDVHQREFGFTLPDRTILVDDVRVRAIGKTAYRSAVSPFKLAHQLADRHKTPIYLVADQPVGAKLNGPALIIDQHHTIVVEPGCTALILPEHVILKVDDDSSSSSNTKESGLSWRKMIGTEKDPAMLAVFGHRFMGIAEQMGETLRKTAVSTNVKERLDFSCAIFGPDGGLVANAPHIPVHLGSLSHAVKFQMDYHKDDLYEGDVIVTNHPQAGGSHLPDITIITPVFDDNKIIFFVASRAHHADIGGILPGSMPPHSKELYQEGAAIISFKLVNRGVFQTDDIIRILQDDPAKYSGCSGTRCLRDNLSDLKAQVAANHKGILLMHALVAEYSLDIVHAYMYHIRDNAEMAVRDLLRQTSQRYKGHALEAVDYMDDGSPICLRITIDEEKGSALFDFTGTAYQVYGNWNAPPSVAHSAIIYCLRCLVQQDIPLNQGCLAPVEVHIPPGSLLAPDKDAAVVGGNVLTSQRVVDVILRAFNACAASQGDCNNFTFGTGGKSTTDDKVIEAGWGYYETIAGGGHMTNTRITDPEVLEQRYPVILHEFSLRKNSGGHGQYQGGDGVVRELEFLEDQLQVSLLTERRVYRPYGLAGGEPGQPGLNLWKRTSKGVTLNVGGKNTLMVNKGDRVCICTPGGGGWGPVVTKNE